MLSAVGRSWRSWRDKSRLIAPIWTVPPGLFLSPDLHFSELREIQCARTSELQPYQGMAAVWDEYCSPQLPGYPAFLKALSLRRGSEIRSVLDLACGTGILTERLAEFGNEVVGLDASESMLSAAKVRRGGIPSISFARGDFRSFSLGRQFDAVVCASNSLNYVTDRGELHQVFAAVGEHLRPDGLFVFDTTTERTMRHVSGMYLHALTDERRFAIHFSYDPYLRKETSKAILPAGVETRRRIPLEPDDVIAASEGTGLYVEEYFSGSLLPWRWQDHGVCFFVLAKRE